MSPQVYITLSGLGAVAVHAAPAYLPILTIPIVSSVGVTVGLDSFFFMDDAFPGNCSEYAELTEAYKQTHTCACDYQPFEGTSGYQGMSGRRTEHHSWASSNTKASDKYTPATPPSARTVLRASAKPLPRSPSRGQRCNCTEQRAPPDRAVPSRLVVQARGGREAAAATPAARLQGLLRR